MTFDNATMTIIVTMSKQGDWWDLQTGDLPLCCLAAAARPVVSPTRELMAVLPPPVALLARAGLG